MTTPPPYPTTLSGASHLVVPGTTGRRLVVFFAAKDLGEGRYNFLQLGRELPDTVIFVNNGANDWYQWGIPGLGDSLEASLDSLRRWRDAVQATEICTIGTSMGAYAAIQYGAALGARVLAFSSDAQLGAPLSRSAAFFTGGTYAGARAPTCPDLRPLVGGADVTLFVGERDAVDIHAAHLLQGAGLGRVVSLIGADHHVSSFLSRRSRLGPLLRRFVAGQTLPMQPDTGAAVMQPGHAQALYAAHLAAAAQDWGLTEASARQALAAYPCGEAAEMILGWALIQQDRPAEAADVLARALASQPDDSQTLLRLAAALRRSGGALRAEQLYQSLLTREPGHHAARYALGMVRMQRGDTAGARQALREALRILPGHAPYLARLKAIETKAIKTAGKQS